MRVSIIRKSKINSIILPSKILGNYWISEYDENGTKRNAINIEASKDGSAWNLISNEDIYCYAVEDGKEVPYSVVTLSNYNFYSAKKYDGSGTYYIYCSPVKEQYVGAIELVNNGNQ